MTELQHRIYEVESVVNPTAYRAAVARDRNQQVRRNQWAQRNRNGSGMYDDDDDEDDYDMNQMETTDLLMSASDVALLKNARQKNLGNGMVGSSSQMRYDAHDAVSQRHFVGLGRGIEAAEQSAANAYRRTNGGISGGGGSRSGTMTNGSEKMTLGMLEKILQSQYRAYMATAARVAKVHDVVNALRVQYLTAINHKDNYGSNVDTTGISAGLRRENQHIGSSQLLNRAYAYDPFHDADEREEREKMKQNLRRREEVTQGIAKTKKNTESQSVMGLQGVGNNNGNNGNNNGNNNGGSMFGVGGGGNGFGGAVGAAKPAGSMFGGTTPNALGANNMFNKQPTGSPAATGGGGGFGFGGNTATKPMGTPTNNMFGGNNAQNTQNNNTGGAASGGFSFGGASTPGAQKVQGNNMFGGTPQQGANNGGGFGVTTPAPANNGGGFSFK